MATPTQKSQEIAAKAAGLMVSHPFPRSVFVSRRLNLTIMLRPIHNLPVSGVRPRTDPFVDLTRQELEADRWVVRNMLFTEIGSDPKWWKSTFRMTVDNLRECVDYNVGRRSEEYRMTVNHLGNSLLDYYAALKLDYETSGNRTGNHTWVAVSDAIVQSGIARSLAEFRARGLVPPAEDELALDIDEIFGIATAVAEVERR